MGKLILVIFALFAVAMGGGAVFLATWDIPAPSQSVERVLPDDRFPR